MKSLKHLFAEPAARKSSRRDFLLRTGNGLGLLALAGLLQQEEARDAPLAEAGTGGLNPMAPRRPHFPARARSVIWLFMNGGPSHVDTWDYKPELIRQDGKELSGFDRSTGFFADQVGPLMKSPFEWKQT